MYIDKIKNKGYIFLEDPKTWPQEWISLLKKNKRIVLKYFNKSAATLKKSNHLREIGREYKIKDGKKRRYLKKYNKFIETFDKMIFSTN